MDPYLVDVNVLLIFFARPKQFAKVFQQVKKAKPRRLFLYQDGPRKGRDDDIKNIKICRSIAEEINWECEIYRLYQKENIGCDPSEFIAIKWMFESVDKGIILEDDDVPSLSFFGFCKELLDRYEFDNRIYMISGMNHLGHYKADQGDYLFTKTQSIWGWATWKRCIDLWDDSFKYLDVDDVSKNLAKSSVQGIEFIQMCRSHLSSGKQHYESISWYAQGINEMINIVPSKNLISNIGLGENGVHNGSNVKEYPKVLQGVFYMKTYEIKLPLRHANTIQVDYEYMRKTAHILGWGHPVLQFVRGMEAAIRRFALADVKSKKEKLMRLPRTIINNLTRH